MTTKEASMYREYRIMQEPGPQARARRRRFDSVFSPPMKRAGTVDASGQCEALGDFVHERYVASGNRQYDGHRIQWRREGTAVVWYDWDGRSDPTDRGRRWRVIVTLRNGRNVHDAIFEAWKRDW